MTGGSTGEGEQGRTRSSAGETPSWPAHQGACDQQVPRPPGHLYYRAELWGLGEERASERACVRVGGGRPRLLL